MAKAKTTKPEKTSKSTKAKKDFFNESSMSFITTYMNNASPTGFEASGQKIWLDYLKPYIDTHL